MSFTDAGTRIIEGVSAGLYEGGNIIMAQSQVLVPVDTGTLKRSGVVQEPEFSDGGDAVSVTVGYGYGGGYQARAAAEDPDDAHGYGFWVHERVIVETYRGRPAKNAGKPVSHRPPTQAKFLEVPAKAYAPEFAPVIEANVKAKMGG
ncbi:MAG TPA: hypothetical protein VJQ83_02165 [Tepidiformaceae bacterium]|nr:hypothetical protein [Tepidiformaceae bacterium]